jgi:hypothetical protein
VKQLGLLAESVGQAVEQQIPPTQLPLPQSVSTPHFWPLPDVVPQVLRTVLHRTPALQSLDEVQLVLQLVFPLQA